MDRRSKYLIKNAGILTISNFASKILVFLLVPLYTNVLSTEEVGLFDLSISSIALILPLVTLNIVEAVLRFTMDKKTDPRCIASVGLRYILQGILSFIAILGIIKIIDIFPGISNYYVYVFLYFVSSSLNQLLIQFSKGIDRVLDMGIAGVIGTVSMLVTNILFLLCFKLGLKGFFFANILAQVIPAIFLAIRIKIWRYIDICLSNAEIKKAMIAYSAPLIVTTIGWWINSSSDKYVIAVMISTSASGILAVSYKIPQAINTLHGILMQAWQLSAIKEFDSEDRASFYGNFFQVLNAVLSISCSILILLNKPVAKVLFAKDFYSAWQYVPFLLISCIVNSAASFMGSILVAKKDSKTMAMSSIYGALTNIVLNISLTFLFGMQGVCIATLIASFIIYWKRKISTMSEIIIENYSIVLLTWGLLCVQAVIDIYMFIWWIELIIIVLLLLLNWKTEIRILNSSGALLRQKYRNTREK